MPAKAKAADEGDSSFAARFFPPSSLGRVLTADPGMRIVWHLEAATEKVVEEAKKHEMKIPTCNRSFGKRMAPV